MADKDKFNLFGLTEKQVGQRKVQDAIAFGQQFAGGGPGRGKVALAASLPGLLGAIFDVGGDKAAARARQDALKSAFESSKDDPDNYYAHVAEALNNIGDSQGAMLALEKFKIDKRKKRELDIDEKKVDERSRLKGEQIDLKRELAQMEDDRRRNLAEIEDLRKREIAGEDVRVKLKKMENDMAKHADKMAILENKNEILKDKNDILRIRAGTAQFDAETRRMKLGIDKEIAELKAIQKEKGKLSDAQNKRLQKNYDSYEKFVRSKDLGEVVAKMVDDHPEAGSFFSGVDDKQVAKLIQAEMLDKIAKARIGNVDDFDFDRQLLQTGEDILRRWTTEGENMLGIDRPEMSTPMTGQADDLDAQFNELINK